MKPLTPANAPALLARVENAQGCELRSISVTDPTTMRLRLSVQDRTRDFDWIDLVFEISGIDDARLLEDSKFSMLDTESGVSLLFEGETVVLALGRYTSTRAALDAVIYLKGSSAKYEEAPFSG